jgi:hypothetical protein
MALPPRGERLPSEMNEGTDYSYKGAQRAWTYGLGALGLLGPSPSAQFYSILGHRGILVENFQKNESALQSREYSKAVSRIFNVMHTWSH